MCYASIDEAKMQLSKHISLVENGDKSEVIIMKNGKKAAKLAPIIEEKSKA